MILLFLWYYVVFPRHFVAPQIGSINMFSLYSYKSQQTWWHMFNYCDELKKLQWRKHFPSDKLSYYGLWVKTWHPKFRGKWFFSDIIFRKEESIYHHTTSNSCLILPCHHVLPIDSDFALFSCYTIPHTILSLELQHVPTYEVSNKDLFKIDFD